jgi:hypothetical protein
MQPAGRALVCAAIFLGIVSVDQAAARDCSYSKEFHLRRAQVIAGTLEDPVGAALSGLELQLLSGRKTVSQVRTDSQGGYDFGEVPPGKYRIRIRYGELTPFCAPRIQCGSLACSVEGKVALNPKNEVLVE